MSIELDGLVDHKVADYHDHSAVIARLSPSISNLKQVSDYLAGIFPSYQDSDQTWVPVYDQDYFAYHGPAAFRILFGARVAVIGAPCRHSAFTTIPSLQAVYLHAFRSVAEALGGTCLVLIPDQNDLIEDAAMYEGASLDECIGLVENAWGAPYHKTETISEETVKGRKFPVWYLEPVPFSSA